jgi:hypothetical protein
MFVLFSFAGSSVTLFFIHALHTPCFLLCVFVLMQTKSELDLITQTLKLECNLDFKYFRQILTRNFEIDFEVQEI